MPDVEKREIIIVDIKKREIIVVIMPNTTYNKGLLDITNQLAKHYSSICYVCLNKPHNSIIRSFENNKINKNKFLFVDAVSKPSKVEVSANCISVRSISALTELGITVGKALEKGKLQVLIFDSLSTLLIYHGPATVTRFVHNLIGRVRELNCTAVFTCLEGDAKSNLIKDVGMFVDKIAQIKQ